MENTTAREIVCDDKEKLCYIALDQELNSTAESSDKEVTFELPDDNIVSVGVERFHCQQNLFQPSFIDMGLALLTVFTRPVATVLCASASCRCPRNSERSPLRGSSFPLGGDAN